MHGNKQNLSTEHLIRPLKTRIGNTTEFKKLQCLQNDDSENINDTHVEAYDAEKNEVKTSSENCELVKNQFHEISPLHDLQATEK